MSNSRREQALGYLLGALDDDEAEKLETWFSADPASSREMEQARGELAVLGSRPHDADPPPGLAERTCAWIFNQVDTGVLDDATDEPSQTLTERPLLLGALAVESRPYAVGTEEEVYQASAEIRPTWASQIRWPDLLVAVSIFLTASMLLLPALQRSRFQARMAVCQDNLRELGLALTQYSERNGGYFPQIPARGQLAAAGLYAPILASQTYVTAPERFLCAGSPLAARSQFRVPLLEELEQASASELARLKRVMGGSYAYSLGYVEDGRYHGVRNQRRPQYALLADDPSFASPNCQSANHDGLGQNVLFEDGRVSFVHSPRPEGWKDHVYLNDAGRPAAGMHGDDSVVGPSHAPPLPSSRY